MRKGRVVYIGAPVDAVDAEYGHPDYKRLLVNAVGWAAGDAPPPVEVDAPTTVEAVAWEIEETGELRVHLVNRTTAGRARARSAVLQETIPLLDVTLRATGSRHHTSGRGVVAESALDIIGLIAISIDGVPQRAARPGAEESSSGVLSVRVANDGVELLERYRYRRL